MRKSSGHFSRQRRRRKHECTKSCRQMRSYLRAENRGLLPADLHAKIPAWDPPSIWGYAMATLWYMIFGYMKYCDCMNVTTFFVNKMAGFRLLLRNKAFFCVFRSVLNQTQFSSIFAASRLARMRRRVLAIFPSAPPPVA